MADTLEAAFQATSRAVERAELDPALLERAQIFLDLGRLLSRLLMEWQPSEGTQIRPEESTIADRLAMGVAVGFLAARPATARDEVFGEELSPVHVSPRANKTIADSIDNTASWSARDTTADNPWATTLFSCDADGQPLISLIVLPTLRQVVIAAGDAVSLVNGEPLAASGHASDIARTRVPRKSPEDLFLHVQNLVHSHARSVGATVEAGRGFTLLDMLDVGRGSLSHYAYCGVKSHDALPACHAAWAAGGAVIKMVSPDALPNTIRSYNELIDSAPDLFPLSAVGLGAASDLTRQILLMHRR